MKIHIEIIEYINITSENSLYVSILIKNIFYFIFVEIQLNNFFAMYNVRKLTAIQKHVKKSVTYIILYTRSYKRFHDKPLEATVLSRIDILQKWTPRYDLSVLE